MTIVIVQHQCADFDVWKPIFDEHGSTRKAHGCKAERVYQAADDPNTVAVIMEWPSPEAAAGFMSDPSLAEAMQRGGVTGPPTVTFGDVAPGPSV